MKQLLLVTAGLLLLQALPVRTTAQTLDPTFTPQALYAPGSIYSALEQPDGKKVVIGNFTRLNSLPSPAARAFQFKWNH